MLISFEFLMYFSHFIINLKENISILRKVIQISDVLLCMVPCSCYQKTRIFTYIYYVEVLICMALQDTPFICYRSEIMRFELKKTLKYLFIRSKQEITTNKMNVKITRKNELANENVKFL